MTESKKLNKILFRKLNGGDWVLLTWKNDPIIVNEKIKNDLILGNINKLSSDKQLMNILQSSGFFTEDRLENLSLTEENNSFGWYFVRWTLLIIGMISVIGIVILTFFLGIPTGNMLISDKVNIFKNLGFLLFFSLLTTIGHEIMHMIFGQTQLMPLDFKVSLKQAVAKVSLSHVWVWTKLGRITAISAGIILDLFELLVLSSLQIIISTWILAAACSILWIRIIWQFRIHKRYDGQLLIAMIRDNPFLNQEINEGRKPDVIYFKAVGYFITFIIILFWLIPLLICLFQRFI
ncbi:hypothetical protein ACVPPR_02280 [Dellaglioa sp. L3N]